MLLQSFSGHDAFVLQLEAVKTEYILFCGRGQLIGQAIAPGRVVHGTTA